MVIVETEKKKRELINMNVQFFVYLISFLSFFFLFILYFPFLSSLFFFFFFTKDAMFLVYFTFSLLSCFSSSWEG